MTVYFFAFLAGVVTILAPCVLPILPIVFSGAASKGAGRPWGIILGVVFSFSTLTLALSWLVRNTGLSPEFGRWFGILLLVVVGIVMLVPRITRAIEGIVSSLISRGGGPRQRNGFFGGFILGMSLGAVWTPCAGPILAAVIGAAQSGDIDTQLVIITFAYALGAALPMGLIAGFGQELIGRVRWLSARAGKIQQAFGVLVLVMALLMATGVDRKIQTAIIQATPDWLASLQGFEEDVDISDMTPRFESTAVAPGSTLPNYGAAPELREITGWINSEPTTLTALRGKVVLVKFWTYSCINCIRTLPYVQRWYDTYKDKGFEIIAVHTPEFEFEKVPKNVESATKDFRITYPIALDPNYGTWNAYSNRYWPAEYLIDAAGNIRYTHFGEGSYDETERAIQELLKENGQSVTDQLLKTTSDTFLNNQSPETYFGLARAERYAGSPKLSTGTRLYGKKQDLNINAWALNGTWSLSDEYAESSPDATLEFRAVTKNMYVVMEATEAGASVEVTVDGEGGTQIPVSSATVNTPTLYRVAILPDTKPHLVKLLFPTGKVRIYAATFGGDAPGVACSQDGSCNVEVMQ